MKYVEGKDYPTDLQPLAKLLVKAGLKFTVHVHPAANPEVKKAIGYFPMGDHQILIKQRLATYSVIRGLASFGNFEILRVDGRKKNHDLFFLTERFERPNELVKALLEDRP
jgi:hypothetical protein